jgi:hypothetical protein
VRHARALAIQSTRYKGKLPVFVSRELASKAYYKVKTVVWTPFWPSGTADSFLLHGPRTNIRTPHSPLQDLRINLRTQRLLSQIYKRESSATLIDTDSYGHHKKKAPVEYDDEYFETANGKEDASGHETSRGAMNGDDYGETSHDNPSAKG